VVTGRIQAVASRRDAVDERDTSRPYDGLVIPPLLDELLRAAGPSGTEDEVMAVVRREAAGLGDVEADVHGNTVVRMAGTGCDRTLGVFAHADEIGVIVTHVEESGLLCVARLGNWKAESAVGARVSLLGARGSVSGVIVHGGEGDATWTSVRVDIGAVDADDARRLVEPGDSGVLVGDPVAVGTGRVLSKALDNRVGVYIALEAGRRLAALPPDWNVVIVVNGLEEGDSRGGAVVAARSAAADAALVLEVTYAADAPGADPAEWGNSSLGGGPTVFRGPSTHPVVTSGLRACAQAASIPLGIEAGLDTWSDVEGVQEALAGVPVGLVAVPLRYMHSANEIVQLSDVEHAIELVEAYARSLDGNSAFMR
jgi:putative aminopeptidase FrvX